MGFLDDTVSLTLDNGVRLCCLSRPGSSVEMQFHIGAGSIEEQEHLGCGLSHFLEHMSFQGCAGYPERLVASEVNRLGGSVNAYTSYDRTCYRMQLPREHWRSGIAMLAAMVRHPEFPEERFVGEREVILRECERGRDDPSRRLFEFFMETMFLRHPLRYPVIGFPEMISSVTREMVMAYHRRRYTPGRCVVAAVGEIEAEAFFAEAAEKLGDWRRGELAEPALNDEPYPVAARHGEFLFPDPAERLMWGFRAPGPGDRDLPALELLMGMLGAGDSSILPGELVLKKHLGLDLRSFCYMPGGVSLMGFSGKAEPGKISRLQRGLRELLADAASGKCFSASRLKREKAQTYADHLRSLRDPVNVAEEIACGTFYNNSPASGEAFWEKVRRVDLGEVREAAAKYLDLDRWTMVRQRSRPAAVTAKRHPPLRLTVHPVHGKRAVYVPDRKLPLCNFHLVFPGGSIRESAGQYGISRLLAAMLTAGCDGLGEEALLGRLDEAGAEVEVSAGANTVMFSVSAPRRGMGRAMELIGRILTSPAFPEGALEREKRRLIDELELRSSDPVKAAGDLAARLLYGDHPYAFSRGRAEDIASLSAGDLAGFFDRCRRTPGAAWGFGGDCGEKEAAQWNEIISPLFCGGKPSAEVPQAKFPAERIVRRIVLPREQTVAMRMIPGVGCAADPREMDLVDLLSAAENGLASRLFESVREKNALSYAVGMSYAAGWARGIISFYAMTAAGAGEQVMRLLDEEMLRLGDTGLDEAEFAAAKSVTLARTDRSFDTPEAALVGSVMDLAYGMEPLPLSARRERIEALTREEFNRRLKPYFAGPAGAEVLVLPSEKASR